jgi:diacylglycerol kinase family enzyme
VVWNPAKLNLSGLRDAVVAEELETGRDPSLWFPTAREDDGAQAVRDAVSAHPDALLVAGGDGTVRTAAQQLAGTGIPFAVAAAGTGNLFARALRLPIGDLPAAVRAAFTGAARPIDLGQATLHRPDGTRGTHGFLVMAGIGLDARMATDTNAYLKKRLGWLAYADPVGRSVIANVKFAMHYRLDGGRRHSTRAHTVIVGNCGTLTGGILLIPDARPDDGVLDTVILRPRGVGGWIQIGLRLAFARFLNHTATGNLLRRLIRLPYALRFAQARHIVVAFNTPQAVELDGDGFGTITGADVTIQPAALRLLTNT